MLVLNPSLAATYLLKCHQNLTKKPKISKHAFQPYTQAGQARRPRKAAKRERCYALRSSRGKR
jgi:hypothetical protein